MSETQVYFKDIRNVIIKNLYSAENEILIAVAWFTDTKIIKVLNELSLKGIKVAIIFYDDKINNKNLFESLYYQNAEIKVSKKLMHNKFCIIDKHTVINGSYNWTNNASTNDENIQINRYNYELVNSFVEQFIILKSNCESINTHFKYSIENISSELNYFNTQYRENLKTAKSTPYFYKFKNIAINEIHISKVSDDGTIIKNKEFIYQQTPQLFIKKEGIIVIKNRQEEYNFFLLLHLLRGEIPLYEILKFKQIGLIFPRTYDFILNLDFESNYTLQSKNYILKSNRRISNIQYDSKIKRPYIFDFSIIDPFGNILNEHHGCQIMDNGFFLKDLQRIYDHNFNKINLIGEAKKIVDKIGYVNFNKKYGLVDYTGNNIIENRFDYFYVTEDEKIEFVEFPISIIKDSYVDGKSISMIQKYIRYSEQIKRDRFWNESRIDKENSIYKSYIFSISDKKIAPATLRNTSEQSNYIFISDNFEVREFTEIFSTLSMPLSKYNFYLEIFKSKSKHRSSIEKSKISKDLLNLYQNNLMEEEKRKTDKSCYIATMVYEDANHPKVEYLRRYRDNTLIKHFIGRQFIRYYYEYSPSVVNILKDKPKINYLIKLFLDNLIRLIKNI